MVEQILTDLQKAQPEEHRAAALLQPGRRIRQAIWVKIRRAFRTT
jgi:hypothetical protein